jgi:hypothetical protein
VATCRVGFVPITPSEVDVAYQRMLDAEDVMNRRLDDDDWTTWQRAATDYWILCHPEIARWRRPPVGSMPTVAEMRERAELVARAMDDIPDDWRLRPPSRQRAEYLARVGWFHELMVGLYGPVYDAIGLLKAGDSDGIEMPVRFLEADVYCFRSGYVKADAIRFLTRADLSAPVLGRLQRVVIDVISTYDRREFRSYIRLARRVDSPAFRAELRSIAAASWRHPARRAAWTLVGLGEGPPVRGEAD